MVPSVASSRLRGFKLTQPAEIAGGDHRQQVQPEVGRGSPMG